MLLCFNCASVLSGLESHIAAGLKMSLLDNLIRASRFVFFSVRKALILKNISAYVFGNISGNYGHDSILRFYLGLPSWLKLSVVIQHGWYKAVYEKDLNAPGIYLVWSRRLAEDVRRVSNKRVIVLGSPFALYRRKANLLSKANASGTVAFPQHSSPNNRVEFDIESYCDALSALTDEYKPITVCLHYRDIDEWGGVFKKRGFDVVTAGKGRQNALEFVKNFYSILSRHRYATSNDIGSYLFYAVDMGIPFFLMGDVISYYDRHTGALIRSSCSGDDVYKDVFTAFSVRVDKITEEQASLVEKELGLDGNVNPRDLYLYIMSRFFFIEVPMVIPRFFYKLALRVTRLFN